MFTPFFRLAKPAFSLLQHLPRSLCLRLLLMVPVLLAGVFFGLLLLIGSLIWQLMTGRRLVTTPSAPADDGVINAEYRVIHKPSSRD